jgi:hypothetical protein
MSDNTNTDTKLAQQTVSPPSPETVYQKIHQTLQALDTICIDGHSPTPIPTALTANSFKKLIPETESGMKLSEALPMSDADIAGIKIRRDLETSVEAIRAKVQSTAKTLNEISGARIRVAYRLCRYMSHLLGYGAVGEPSIFTMAGNTAEVNRYEIPFPYDPIKGLTRGMTTPRIMLEAMTNAPYIYSFNFGDTVYTTKGMSVLPPPLHDSYFPDPAYIYRKKLFTPVDYDPKGDIPLTYYLNIMEYLVNYLEIGSSTGGGAFTGVSPTTIDKTPRTQNIEDRSATLALLNPNIARIAWPCRDDLETFEEYVLIPHVERILVKNTPLKAENILKETMGLTHPEAVDYLEVAKTYARDAHNFDPDRERSLLVNKLHRLAGRCDDAGMVSTELKSIMSISQILGLTKHVEDTNIDKRAGLKSALEEKLNAKKIIEAELSEDN